MAYKSIEPRWVKGQSGNPAGRPKKFVTTMKDMGYKLHEINDTIQAMMAMDMNQLKGVFDDPNATILEKTLAMAMRKSLEKGSLYSIETLLSRVYGKPKEQSEVNGHQKIEVVYADRIGKTTSQSSEGNTGE